MKTILYILSFQLFAITSFAEIKVNDPKNVIKSYYQAYNKWDYESLLKLYHIDFKKGLSSAMKIKVEDFDKTMLKNLREGMKLAYKNYDDYKEKNDYKIDSITIEEAEENQLYSVVTVSGLMHGKQSSGKMVFILKKNEKGIYKIKDLGKYELYQKLLKQQLEEEKQTP